MGQALGRGFTLSDVDRARLVENFGEWLDRGRFEVFPRVAVHGVEVTQAIQYQRAAEHLTDSADRGADNTVRLVADKPAWVRVYVRALRPTVWAERAAPRSGVSATLLVDRRRLGFQWTRVATISPRPPGSVTAPTSVGYDAERSNVASTLNFVIPSDKFRGYLRLTVQLTIDGDMVDEEVVYADASLRQTLRVRGILVSYNGPSTAAMPPAGSPPPPNINLAAPTLAALGTTAARAMRMMPVQTTGWFTSAGTLAWTRPLDDPRLNAGGCSANWNLLLTALTNLRTADGNRTDAVYYGLLPAGIPLGVPGCGQGGLGSGAAGDQTTFVHEIGHGYGFAHTPCGATGTPDASYPVYEPYPSASIGEYGLDISNGAVMRPASTFDYMSYCGPQWMSLYQHQRLVLHGRLGQEWLREEFLWDRYVEWREYWLPRDLPDPPPWEYGWDRMRFERVISLTGIVDPDGDIVVQTVARVEAAGQPPGTSTTLVAKLLDAEGRVLSRGVVHRLAHHGSDSCCTCADGDHDQDAHPYVFQAFVPDVDDGAALEITGHGETRWRREATGEPVTIASFDAECDGTVLHVRWKAGGRGSKRPKEGPGLEGWLQWSGDDGEQWWGLSTGLGVGESEVDCAGLPPGEVLLRLLVHDGFWTTRAEPVRVEIPPRPPEVAVLSPYDGERVPAGVTLRLLAQVVDQAGMPITDCWVRWLVDGEAVAQGLDAWVTAPGEGEHRITVLVRVDGHEIEEHRRIVCEPGPGSEQPLC